MGDVVEATVVNAKAKSSIGFLYKEAGRTQGRVGWANSTESESICKVLLQGISFGGGKRVYLSRRRQRLPSGDVWKALLKAWYFNGIPSSERGIEDAAYVFIVRTDPIEAGRVSEEVSPSALTQHTKT
jgi:hypothetical protein